jgi:hypothetical protein
MFIMSNIMWMRSLYSLPKDELETLCVVLSVCAFLYEAL